VDKLLQHLQRIGVNYLKSDSVIILEILENRLHLASEIDVLINELLDKLQSSKLKKVRFECPKTLLDSLNCTRNKMEIIGENLPVGWGEPVFDRLDADIAHAMIFKDTIK